MGLLICILLFCILFSSVSFLPLRFRNCLKLKMLNTLRRKGLVSLVLVFICTNQTNQTNVSVFSGKAYEKFNLAKMFCNMNVRLLVFSFDIVFQLVCVFSLLQLQHSGRTYTVIYLTLFRMGGNTSFSLVTSTNVRFSPQNCLTFSFNPSATRV